MAAIGLEHIAKAFPNGFRAVDDLSLDVADGEMLVLVGPSGCGKTTILRMIAGLERLSAGTIRIGSRMVNLVPPRDRDVAMVFQNCPLYPHLTVCQNMAFGLRMRGVARAEIDRQVRQAAKMLAVEELLGLRPGQLSGGQQQRVALGKAIVRRPACFLLDEPLTHLDAGLRVDMRAELARLHRQLRTTTIHVTHDQEEAMALGDRVAVVREGRLQQVAPPLEIYRSPVNRFVARFFGAPPMNLLEGTLVAAQGRLWLDEGSQRVLLPADAVPLVESRVGGRIVLGIRPEAVRLRPAGGPPDAGPSAEPVLRVTIDAVRPLGYKTDVECSTAAHGRLAVRLDARECPQPGLPATLFLPPDSLHYFAPDDDPAGRPGENLRLATMCTAPGMRL